MPINSSPSAEGRKEVGSVSDCQEDDRKRILDSSSDRMMFGSMNPMTTGPGPGGLALKTEAGWPPHPAMHPAAHPMVGQDHLAAAAAASAAAAVGQSR